MCVRFGLGFVALDLYSILIVTFFRMHRPSLSIIQTTMSPAWMSRAFRTASGTVTTLKVFCSLYGPYILKILHSVLYISPYFCIQCRYLSILEHFSVHDAWTIVRFWQKDVNSAIPPEQKDIRKGTLINFQTRYHKTFLH